MMSPGLGLQSAPPLKSLTAYEQKMMRRLELANRRAAYEAAGVPLPKKKEQAMPRPQAASEPDHERLLHLAKDARSQGNLFFYYPSSGDALKERATALGKSLKEEETKEDDLRQRNEDHPERGLTDFFERLEEVQHEERRAQIESGEIEDPSKVCSQPPAATSAGKPHEVVVENGLDEDGAPSSGEQSK
ncbi:unnamed protein product, partial [Polarella glacialis]